MLFAKLEAFPNYRIYINGDIISETKRNEYKMKPRLDSVTGYYTVGLTKDGKLKKFSIHRLLAMCFLPCNCNFSDVTVDHINISKTDNRIENLRWCDYIGQNLNRKYKETNSGYPFITKCKHSACKSGFVFNCKIQRRGKYILRITRVNLDDAVASVREFLLRDPIVFEGLPRETVELILDKYKLNSEITLLL